MYCWTWNFRVCWHKKLETRQLKNLEKKIHSCRGEWWTGEQFITQDFQIIAKLCNFQFFIKKKLWIPFNSCSIDIVKFVRRLHWQYAQINYSSESGSWNHIVQIRRLRQLGIFFETSDKKIWEKNLISCWAESWIYCSKETVNFPSIWNLR